MLESDNLSEVITENYFNDKNATVGDYLNFGFPVSLQPEKEGIFIGKEFMANQNFPELVENNQNNKNEEPCPSSKVNLVCNSSL